MATPTAGAGVDLARRMIVAYCDGGDREALRVINAADSERELGYACGYLLAALAEYAQIITATAGEGSRRAALELLKAAALSSAAAADAVIAEANEILLNAGDADE